MSGPKDKTVRKSKVAAKQKTAAPAPSMPSVAFDEFPFTRHNYVLLLISLGILALGYILLSLDRQFVDANQFSVSLYIAPPVIALGYGFVIYAILSRDPRLKKQDEMSHPAAE